MFSRLVDYDRTFDVLDELRRQMDRAWDDFDGTWGVSPAPSQALTNGSWPRIDVLDAGANVLVSADVPGLSEKDLDVSLEDGVLTVRGERKAEAAEGYTLHRRERAARRSCRTGCSPCTFPSPRRSALDASTSARPEARARAA